MRYTRSEIIEYFLQLFSLPQVKEEIAKYANAFMGEASRFTSILPQSFYPQEKKNLLTKEGIEADLRKK